MTAPRSESDAFDVPALDAAPPSSASLVAAVARLGHQLRAQRALFVGSTALIVAMQVTAAAVAALTAAVAARIAAAHFEGTGLWLALLALSVVLLGVCTWLESWWSHVLAYRVLSALRIALHAAIARIAPRGLAGRRTGEVAGAAVNDAEQLEWFYAHTAGATLSALVTPPLLIAVSWWLAGPVALLQLVGLAALLVPLWLLGPVQARQGEAVRAELSRLKSESLEGAQGLRDLLTLGAADRATTLVAEGTRRVQRAKRLFALRVGVETSLADAIVAGVAVTMLALLADGVRHARVEATVVPVAVALVFATFTPVTSAFGMWQRLGEMAAAASRIHRITRAPANVSNARADDAPFDARGTIEFDDVTVRHGARTALRAASLRLRPGETVVVMGSSGAGKSTLAALLARLVDPDEGRVLVGGRDLTTVHDDRVRRHIVLAPQTSFALRGTLAENLRLARPDASDEQLRAALRAAALDDTVQRFEHGLDTHVGEGGSTLSGGELQRLAIARALLLEPEVLVLDEPVANLDALAESTLMTAVRSARAGRTTIVISHRPSTVRHADRVVVIEDGRITDVGTPAELERRSARYRRLLVEAPATPDAEGAPEPEGVSDADGDPALPTPTAATATAMSADTGATTLPANPDERR